MTSTDFDELAEHGHQMMSRGVSGREALRHIAQLAFERGQRMARPSREKGPDYDATPESIEPGRCA